MTEIVLQCSQGDALVKLSTRHTYKHETMYVTCESSFSKERSKLLEKCL